MKKIPVIHFVTKLLIVLFCFSATTLSNNPDSTIISKRLQLISINDSIDLIKQTNKRKGLSLTELEEKQSVVRDSLKMINIQIQNTKISSNSTTLLDLANLLSRKPATIFDWIIIVVGLIAVISGFFLISGIFSMFSSKKKMVTSKKTAKKVSDAPPKKQTIAPQPVASPKHSIDELRALAGNTSDSVNQLRRQLKNIDPSSSNQPEIINHTINLSPEDEMPPSLFSESIDQNDMQTQQKIIDAATNGMNPLEISRKFHISTDQVLLTLKVAGVKQKK